MVYRFNSGNDFFFSYGLYEDFIFSHFDAVYTKVVAIKMWNHGKIDSVSRSIFFLAFSFISTMIDWFFKIFFFFWIIKGPQHYTIRKLPQKKKQNYPNYSKKNICNNHISIGFWTVMTWTIFPHIKKSMTYNYRNDRESCSCFFLLFLIRIWIIFYWYGNYVNAKLCFCLETELELSLNLWRE